MEYVYGEKYALARFFSDEFKLEDFFSKNASAFKERNVNKRCKSISFNKAANIKMSSDEFKALSKKCDPSQLFPKITGNVPYCEEGFKPQFTLYDVDSVETDLELLKITKDDEKRNARKKPKDLEKSDYELEIRGSVNPKYRGEVELNYLSREKTDRFRPKNLTSKIDGVAHISVKSPDGNGKFIVSQEFLISSEMPLTALKDRILCPEDFQHAYPLNPCSNIRKLQSNKNGIFYIGFNFYVDHREGEDKVFDYSKSVIEWLGTRGIKATREVYKMEDTRIRNLHVRLGFPYLYQHQCSCQHQIVFSDIRLMNRSDSPFLEDYPLMTSYANITGHYCNLCNGRVGKWIITDCELLQLEYSIICNTCYFTYLHDGQGYRKAPFVAYKYVDRSALL